jgi:hypothetical protein
MLQNFAGQIVRFCRVDNDIIDSIASRLQNIAGIEHVRLVGLLLSILEGNTFLKKWRYCFQRAKYFVIL